MMMPERSLPLFDAVMIWNCGRGAGAASGMISFFFVSIFYEEAARERCFPECVCAKKAH